ncbi:MAG: S9 family peptidase [Gemmatimonadetes bacterium]|nr:S9 family peptidase [Gemmatimonadota bacterium]
MNPSRRLRVPAFVVALLAAHALAPTSPTQVEAQAGRDLTPMDVATMKSVTGVYPSPDGSRIAFTRSEPRGPADSPGGAYTNLYMLGGDHGPRPLVAGKRNVVGVAWHPGGNLLTFLDTRDGDSGRQLYALSMAGGEASRVFDAGRGVSQYRWRPDGMAVAFTAVLPTPPNRAVARQAGFDQRVYDEDFNPIGLFVWDHDTGEIRQYAVPGSVYSFEWSPDGDLLALQVAPRALTDDSMMFKRIRILDVASGRIQASVENPGKLGGMAFSPDSHHLAYISAADPRDPHAGMLYMVPAAGGEPSSLTSGWEGMAHSLEWMNDHTLRARVSRGVESAVSDFDVESRTWSDLPALDMAFGSVHTAGSTVVAAISGPTHPAEVYTLEGGSWSRRTDSNPWMEEVRLTPQETYAFQARDGLEIQGLLLYPEGFTEGNLYPMVIVAHGGPESHYNNQWVTGYNTWGQLLSSKGYLVWFPNYRSSTGRGVEFAKADHGDPMGREFQDHLDAIDHFVERGWVDRDRVGVGGGSYGGYTAAWAATRHTEHFAVAVSFVPITHVPTKWLTSDIPWEFYYVHYEETWPTDEEQWDFLSERSPLTFAANARTPLLLAGGTADPRVHPSQPHMLYRAVKASTDTPVRYVQYPGEGHGNGVSTHRYDYMLRALRWFDYYLRPGDHRGDAPPSMDLDYGAWLGGR